MVKVSGKQKIKQANRQYAGNKTYRHDKKRRDKARMEKIRKAHAIEKRGQLKNARRKAEANYVASLSAELQQ